MPPLWPADRAASHVWIARDTRVERKSQSSPRIERGLVRLTLNLQEPAARQSSDFRAAEAFEQRHAPVSMRTSGGLRADEHQPGGMVRVARGIRQRHHAAK